VEVICQTAHRRSSLTCASSHCHDNELREAVTRPAVTSHRYDMTDVKRSLTQQLIEANVISHLYDLIDAKWNEKSSHSPPKTATLTEV
jgi:hypothetical protein